MNPDPETPDTRISTLGDDLVLLSLAQGNGRIVSTHMTGIGLMGAELVQLAASGRIAIEDGRVVVLDPAPTADIEADAALAGLAAARRPPKAASWCSRPRRGICEAYLARLKAAGVIRAEERLRLAFITVLRWRITDAARAADTRARLDAIAQGTGRVDLAQAALGGLVHAIGLAARLYPGRDGRDRRKRLELVAEGEVTEGADGHGAQHAVAHSVHAASHAAVSAAVHAATHAAVSAAHSAASSHGGGAGGGGHH